MRGVSAEPVVLAFAFSAHVARGEAPPAGATLPVRTVAGCTLPESGAARVSMPEGKCEPL